MAIYFPTENWVIFISQKKWFYIGYLFTKYSQITCGNVQSRLREVFAVTVIWETGQRKQLARSPRSLRSFLLHVEGTAITGVRSGPCSLTNLVTRSCLQLSVYIFKMSTPARSKASRGEFSTFYIYILFLLCPLTLKKTRKNKFLFISFLALLRTYLFFNCTAFFFFFTFFPEKKNVSGPYNYFHFGLFTAYCFFLGSHTAWFSELTHHFFHFYVCQRLLFYHNPSTGDNLSLFLFLSAASHFSFLNLLSASWFSGTPMRQKKNENSHSAFPKRHLKN